MRSFECRQLLAATLVLLAACSVSCHRSGSNSAAAKTAKPGPEESFSEIYDVFRRRMEDTQIGFVMSDSTGRSRMTGANKVSYELIRPKIEGEPYKAVVTVASQSHYSILRNVEGATDDAREKAAKDQSGDALDETDQDAIPFDSGTTGNTANEDRKQKPTIHPGEEPVARKKDEEVRKYELVYENGRWSLVTKLDPQTEKSIEYAFKNALDTQI